MTYEKTEGRDLPALTVRDAQVDAREGRARAKGLPQVGDF